MWQPIETAPRDGSEVLLSNGRDVWTAAWCVEWYGTKLPGRLPYSGQVVEPGWLRSNLDEEYGYPENDATHWQPLPDPPKRNETLDT